MIIGPIGKKAKVLDHAVGVVLPSMRGEQEQKFEHMVGAWSNQPGLEMEYLGKPEPTLKTMQHHTREHIRIMHTGSGYMPEYGMVPLDDALNHIDGQQEHERREYKQRIASDPVLYKEAEAAYNESLKSGGLRGKRDPMTRSRGGDSSGGSTA